MSKEMTREEAYKLAMKACEETWNENVCKKIKAALSAEPARVDFAESEDMTSEQAIEYLDSIKDAHRRTIESEYGDYMGSIDKEFHRGCMKACDMGIAALKSWEKYSAKLWQIAYERGKREAQMGRWEEVEEWARKFGNWRCSECRVVVDKQLDTCPYCETKMEVTE